MPKRPTNGLKRSDFSTRPSRSFRAVVRLRLFNDFRQLTKQLPSETGHADWDRVTLKKLAPVVDFHSVHSKISLA